jgi:hypothetical protein
MAPENLDYFITFFKPCFRSSNTYSVGQAVLGALFCTGYVCMQDELWITTI